MKVFRIDRFDGGYNTAVAEANIPINMSGDMLNVDFTETGALTRRSGYTTVSATFGSGTAIKSLYRYYQSDGDKYWMGVNATALYYKQYVSTEFGWTRKEGLYLTFSGGRTEITDASMSGGSVSRVVAATTVTVSGIPYSNRIGVRFYTPTAASFKVDAAAYTNLAATYYVTAVSATSHTITVKPAARNNKSMKLTGGTGQYCTAVYDLGSARASRHVQLWVRPPAALASGGVIGVGLSDSATPYSVPGAVMYDDLLDPMWGGGSFTYHGSGFSATRVVKRSGSFDRIDLYQNGTALSVYVNDQLAGTDTSSATTRYLVCQVYGNAAAYIDNVQDGAYVRVPYAYNPFLTLKSDLDSVTAWTKTDSSAVAATTSTTYAETSVFPWYIDYVDYASISTPTRLDTTVAATADTIGFAVANDVLYWGSKYDPLKSWNGTTSATVTSTVRAEFLTLFKYRLFAASGYLLNYTAVDDYDGWAVTGGGSINVAEADSGAFCTGLKVWQDRLFWFGPSSIHYIDVTGDPVNWERRVITRAFGCVAPKTLADAGNALVFLSAKSVRAYGVIPGINSEDGSGVMELSRFIAPTIASIPQSMLTKACATVYKGRYWLACSTASTSVNDTLLVCDLDHTVKVGELTQPVWTRYSISGISSFSVTRGDEYGLYAGTSTGHIINLDTGTDDDGAAISLRYVTPPLGIKGYSTVKHFRTLHTSVEADTAQTITVTPSTDDVSGPVLTLDVTGQSDLQPIRKSVPARGRYMKYTIESDGAAQPVTLHSLETVYHPDERLR